MMAIGLAAGLAAILAAAEPRRVREGRKLYIEHCVACHAVDGSGGGRGADLRGKLEYGEKAADVFQVIKQGIPAMMPGTKLDDRSIRKLADYVLYMNRRARTGTRRATLRVPKERSK